MRPGILLPLLAILALFALSFSLGWGGERAVTDLSQRFLPPSAAHILGTDELGRDVFARLLEGGRVSLSIALIAALACAVLGVSVGVGAGYAGGAADAALMRLTDFLIALPVLPLLIVLSAVDAGKLGFSPSPAFAVGKIVLLVSLFGWTTTARLARARTLSLRSMDFVRAARALGVGRVRLVLRHILPNLMDTVAIAAALSVGHIILLESVLSFLGLGIQPPMASWGNMLANAEENIWEHASLAVWPGLMIFVTVLAFNRLADGLSNRRA